MVDKIRGNNFLLVDSSKQEYININSIVRIRSTSSQWASYIYYYDGKDCLNSLFVPYSPEEIFDMIEKIKTNKKHKEW